MKNKLSTIIRGILTVVLLYFVWRNSHKSVALSLTLIAIAIETINYNVKKLKVIHIETGLGRKVR